MRLDFIKPEPTLGKGWARVTFRECSGVTEFESMAITRPSHQKSYLGKFGWQISECRLPLSLENIKETEFSILLPPAIVQHMEVSSNYKFIFFDRDVQQTDSVIFKWSGISYRAPDGEASPIEIILQDDVSKFEKISDTKPLEERRKIEENDGYSSPTIDTPPQVGWSVQENNWGTQLHEPTLTNNEPQPLPPATATQPITLRKFQRVKCINHNCGAEILDNMKICPFCNTEREGY